MNVACMTVYETSANGNLQKCLEEFIRDKVIMGNIFVFYSILQDKLYSAVYNRYTGPTRIRALVQYKHNSLHHPILPASQKALEGPTIKHACRQVWDRYKNPFNQARFAAVTASLAGDWLHALLLWLCLQAVCWPSYQISYIE